MVYPYLMFKRGIAPVSLLLAMAFLSAGCSVKRFMVNRMGDALSSGRSVFETDDDIGLVGDAMPFGLKMMESLLEASPDHRGLLLAACRGFTVYTYAYVLPEADEFAEGDFAKAEEVRTRARKLLLRARKYGLRALELRHRGVGARLLADPRGALSWASREDVPLLYWNAASLGLAISVSRNDAEMLACLPQVEALAGRALELDEGWDAGSLHEFMLTMSGSKLGATADDLEAARRHYERALELSGGRRASLFVTYAETGAVKRQDRALFRSLLEKALAVDPDADEGARLANALAKRRAGWLLGREDSLFLGDEQGSPAGRRGR